MDHEPQDVEREHGCARARAVLLGEEQRQSDQESKHVDRSIGPRGLIESGA